MITALQGQSLLDIAIQEAGSPEAAFALALANERSVTGALQAGDMLSEVEITDRPVADYYRAKQLKPATFPGADAAFAGGIGEMAIEINFIVS
jgi:hypothetical protein